MIAVGDLGAVLHWVGLVPGGTSPMRAVVSADALLGEIVEYLKVRHDGAAAAVVQDLTEVQIAVSQWYPTWPVAGRLAALATGSGTDLDATLLVPVALAAEIGLPLATTSDEIADVARPHVSVVVLL